LSEKIPNNLCSFESKCVFLWVARNPPGNYRESIVLWHNCLVVPNRGVGGNGRGDICGPPPAVDFKEQQNWLQNQYFK